MKINEKIQEMENCIEAINMLNADKRILKKELYLIFPLMLNTKQNLKNYQILYWNNKEIRNDENFINAYNSADRSYQMCKDKYIELCNRLKVNKLTIKARQRNISKLNKD